ncbi:uncharacterized protein LOC135357797 isoform X2 [Latimeria chalumnae]|uniref:uncharacterized protein LOC135357797 isoform X2 n=1 Tax=Latimeria chalumnae TaxID=7897 RepID=UPI00313CFAF5
MECAFCHGRDEDDITEELLVKEGVAAHVNCMHFSSNLSTQDAQNREGFAKFRLVDVKKEITRGTKLRCGYCKKNGATVGCDENSCQRCYHYPCAVKNVLQIVQGRIYCKDHTKENGTVKNLKKISAPEAQTSVISNMGASPLKHCSVNLNVQTTPSPTAERCTSSSSSQNLLNSLPPGTHLPQSASILSPPDSPGPSPIPSDHSGSSHNILPPSASIEPSHDAPPTSPSIEPSHDAPPTSPSIDPSHNALPPSPSTDPSHNALPLSPSTDPSHNALPPSPSTDASHDAPSTSVSIDPSHNALRSSISRKPSHNASPPSTLIGAGEPGQGGTSPFQTDHPKEGPMLCKCLDMVHKKMKTISQQLSSISTRLGALEDRLAQTAPPGTVSDCPVDQRCSAVGGPSPVVIEPLASGSQGAARSPRRGLKRRGYFLIPYMRVKKVCKRKKM